MYFFLISLGRRALSVSQNVWLNSFVKLSSPGLLIVRGFLKNYYYSFNFTGCNLSIQSLILPYLDLEKYMFLEIYPFHPGCPIYWHIVVHGNFLQSSVFLWYQF